MHNHSKQPQHHFLLNERFTAVFPSLIRGLNGDIALAVVLQAIHYRSLIEKDFDDGWTHFTMQDLGDEIGISKHQAQRAINKLRDPELALLFEDAKPGMNNSKIWRIDHVRLAEICGVAESQDLRNRDTSVAESQSKRSDIAVSTYIEETIKNNKESTRTFQDEVIAACNLLADLIEANGSTRPAITNKWLIDMERINRLDGRTWEQITKAIEWCQNDEFWRANIMSPGKLRKQYDQLRLKAQSQQKSSNLSGWARVIAKLENQQKELES